MNIHSLRKGCSSKHTSKGSLCVCSRPASPRSPFQDPGRLSVAAGWRPLQEDVGAPDIQRPRILEAPRWAASPHSQGIQTPSPSPDPRKRLVKTCPPLPARRGPPPHRPRMWGSRPSVPPSSPLRNPIPFPSLPDLSLTKLPVPSAAARTRGPLSLPVHRRPEEGDWRCRSASWRPERRSLLWRRGEAGRGRGCRVRGPTPAPVQAKHLFT